MMEIKHQDDFDDGWARKRAKFAIRSLGKFIEPKHLKVLVLGCGMGYECDEWRKLGNHVTACDINERRVNHAKRYADETLVCDLMGGIRQNNGSFDIVYSSETFEHLLSAQPFMNECKRVLKDKGFLVLTTDNPCNIRNIFRMLFQNSEYFHELGHLQFYSPKDMRKLLEENGFEVRAIKNIGRMGAVYLVIARK